MENTAPTSPLAGYPSPFSTVHIAAVRDLMRRTYSRIEEEFQANISDRIGRNYTPTSFGLTREKLIHLLSVLPTDSTEDGGSSNAEHARKAVAALSKAASRVGLKGSGPTLKGPVNENATPDKRSFLDTGVLSSPTSGSLSNPTPLSTTSTNQTAPNTPNASNPSQPKPLKTFGVPRRLGRARSPLLMLPSESSDWKPLTQSQVEGATAEAEISYLYKDIDPVTFVTHATREAEKYWKIVDSGMAQPPGVGEGNGSIPEHPEEWETRIIARLATSYVSRRMNAYSNSNNGNNASAGETAPGGSLFYGPLDYIWTDPDLIPSQVLLQKYPPEVFTVVAHTVHPSELIDFIFEEVVWAYSRAVRQAQVEYALKDPRGGGEHLHLNLYLLDSLRYVPPPAYTRGTCHVSFHARPLAGIALSRKLTLGEPLLNELLLAWLSVRPHLGLSGPKEKRITESGAGVPVLEEVGGVIALRSDGMPKYMLTDLYQKAPTLSFENLAFTAFSSPAFQARMPYALNSFVSMLQTQLKNALKCLHHWHRECRELIAAFILQLERAEYQLLHATHLLSPNHPSIGQPLFGTQTDTYGAVHVDLVGPLFPALRDFVQHASALLLARQYATGVAVGQEHAEMAAEALHKARLCNRTSRLVSTLLANDPLANSFTTSPADYSAAVPPDVLPIASEHNRTRYVPLPLDKEAETYAGAGYDDPTLDPVTTAFSLVAGESSLCPVPNSSYEMLDMFPSLVRRLFETTPMVLSTLSDSQLLELIIQVNLALESKADQLASRMHRTLASSAILMSECLRSTVYAALHDLKSFLSQYLPEGFDLPGPEPQTLDKDPELISLGILSPSNLPNALATAGPSDHAPRSRRSSLVHATPSADSAPGSIGSSALVGRPTTGSGAGASYSLVSSASASSSHPSGIPAPPGTSGSIASGSGNGSGAPLPHGTTGSGNRMRSRSFSGPPNVPVAPQFQPPVIDRPSTAHLNPAFDISLSLFFDPGASVYVGGAGAANATHTLEVPAQGSGISTATFNQSARGKALLKQQPSQNQKQTGNASGLPRTSSQSKLPRTASHNKLPRTSSSSSMSSAGDAPATSAASAAASTLAAEEELILQQAREKLEALADDIPEPEPPAPGAELAATWTGNVHAALQPTFDTVSRALHNVVDTYLTATSKFTRPEVDLANAISAVTSPRPSVSPTFPGPAHLNRLSAELVKAVSQESVRTNGLSAASQAADAPGGGGGTGLTGTSIPRATLRRSPMETDGLLFLPHLMPYCTGFTDGGLPNPHLFTVAKDDAAVLEVKSVINGVLQAYISGPEAVRDVYQPLTYLFSQAEKQRVLNLLASPRCDLAAFEMEIKGYDEVIKAIENATPDIVDFGFLTLNVTAVKSVLIARARLLQTLIMKSLKEHVMYAIHMSIARYSKISRMLLSLPSGVPELVALEDWSKGQLTADLRSLELALTGSNGIVDCIALLHTEGLPRELQKAQDSAIVAYGCIDLDNNANNNSNGANHSDAHGDGDGTPAIAPVYGSRALYSAAALATRGKGRVRRSSVGPSGEMIEAGSLAFTREQVSTLRELLSWKDKILENCAACYSICSSERKTLIAALENQETEFQHAIDEVQYSLDRLYGLGDMKNTATAQQLVTALTERLDALDAAGMRLCMQQRMMDLPVNDELINQVANMKQALRPFDRLWKLAAQHVTFSKQVYASPLLENDADVAIRDAETIRVAAIRLTKEFPEHAAAPLELLTAIHTEMEHFVKSDHALLSLLANPGLKEHHWAAMEQALKYALPRDPRLSLSEVLQLGLGNNIGAIEEICTSASKEYALERALDKMKGEWDSIFLDMKPYKNTSTRILPGTTAEAVQLVLDDHIVKTSTMSTSRFAKTLKEPIGDWLKTLTHIQTVLEYILKVQQTWLYLEPIFSSEDIMRQMPAEGMKFRHVDELWQSLTRSIANNNRALAALQLPKMLSTLETCHEFLETIQKGLNNYLEMKRLVFPRFYFLSNDELLEILAETKDPTRVQPHLKKCFEGIAALDFDANLNIVAMLSEENERIPFLPDPMVPGAGHINPADAKGSVEQWLVAVEAAMKRSTAKTLDDAMKAYPHAPSREQWCVEWPGQVVLAVTGIVWTYEVEKAIKERGPEGLKEYSQLCAKQIEDIIIKVRGKLSSLARKSLSALVVLDVHARDVTFEMVEQGVDAVEHFGWNSQLRQYWADDGESARLGMPGSVTIRMINAEIKYGYEYLGNSSRLVITPLTDRCYRTLIGAIHLGLGGAPEGPAGTGKTETTKDLAKAVAIQCVVFNCSDGLDYLAMGKFFKGLAASGAWACFDEFNRIELEVLSVIAQQVLTIQRAIGEKKTTFIFEETELPLRWTCSIFITMNPGYAGRSELPDNLKALFRTVAMMVPDYALISEILLYSYGYFDARVLARKVVTTYKLCSEQLSSQDHYDYGMRAVMAVLRTAGNLKRSFPNEKEEVLILRAIVDVNLPKFLAPDVSLFFGIIQDLFPGVKYPEPVRDRMELAIRDAAVELGVHMQPVVYEKVFQIYEMMLVRHGFMVVGLPWAGKSTALHLLQIMMEILTHEVQDPSQFVPIAFTKLNPKAITLGELYGNFDELTREWTDGVLAAKFKEFAQNKQYPVHHRKWLIFDGPVDAVWIENMNTVLDDNKKLCLTNGEIIAMTDTMSMVFEVQDLAVASPATVSRCGMIYMEPDTLGWKPLVIAWLDHLMEDNPRYIFRGASPNNPENKARTQREAAALNAITASASGKPGTAAIGGGLGPRERIFRKKEQDPRPFTISVTQRVQIYGLFLWLVEPCLVFLRRGGFTEYCATQDQTLVNSLLQLFEACLSQLINAGPGGFYVGTQLIRARPEPTFLDIENLFLFALSRTLGASTDEIGRTAFTEFLTSALTDTSFLKSHEYASIMKIRGWKAPGSYDHTDDPYFSVFQTMEQQRKEAHDAEMREKQAQAEASELTFTPTEFVSVEYPANPYNASDATARLEHPAQQRGGLHDYFYSPTEGVWKPWTAAVERQELSPDLEYREIIVPTTVTTQFDYLVNLLLTNNRRVLICGPSGIGKSVSMKRILLNQLSQEEYMTTIMTFSARTSSAAVQSAVEFKLERRRRGLYGPPSEKKYVVLLDDLNMPDVEKYGAQPPIELLRQFCDHGGWYDLSSNSFITIEDTLLAGILPPSGGGRNDVSPRFLRHFNLQCFASFDDTTLRTIFSSLTSWFVQKHVAFTGDFIRTSTEMVQASIHMYRQATRQLRPTPEKSHYIFNLRDLSRVMEGVFKATPDTLTTVEQYIRVWVHELLRVFYDRLTKQEDSDWFLKELKSTVKTSFKKNFDELFQYLHPLYNATKVQNAPQGIEDKSTETPASTLTVTPTPMLPPKGAPVATFAPVTTEHLRVLLWSYYGQGRRGQYGEITDMQVLTSALQAALSEHNSMSIAKMNLAFFLFAVEHIVRLARVLNLPGGHALLVGMGGSGKRSNTLLAASMCDAQFVSIELTKAYSNDDWRADIKSALETAGTGDGPVVFFFTDTQIKWEGMLEDINALLNNGDLDAFFSPEDRAMICEKVAPAARTAGIGRDVTATELFAFFTKRVRKNFHIVLAMSPVGGAFRDRLRKFPSLITGCTMDWYKVWPQEALYAVARQSLGPLEFPAELETSLIQACQHFHTTATVMSEEYLDTAKRYNYVTPTSFLELLGSFHQYYNERKNSLIEARKRYTLGLEKLDFATENVSIMQQELEALQPSLTQAQAETEVLMKEIQSKLPMVESTRERVAKDAAVVDLEAQKVSAVKEDCEKDLAISQPILDSALESLNTITTSDINYIRNLPHPPERVKMVLSSVCVLLGEKPERVSHDGGRTKVDDYWPTAKKILMDSHFINRLIKYDIDVEDPKRVRLEKVREEFMTLADFKPEIVKSASSAAEGMCKWVIAMSQYEQVSRVVKPKQIALAKAEEELAVTLAALNEKKAALAAVEAEMQKLESDLANAELRKTTLAQQVDLCEKKLQRASLLINGLGGEKTRWLAEVERLTQQMTNVPGDVLFAAGVLAYLGPFTSDFRDRMYTEWSLFCRKHNVAITSLGTAPNPVPSSADSSEHAVASEGGSIEHLEGLEGESFYDQDIDDSASVSSDLDVEPFQIAQVLGNAVEIQQWHLQGLPTDKFSVDNGVIVTRGRRWPLMIDPQGQANQWIRNMEAESGLLVVKLTDPGFLRTMENAVQFGRTVLLENVGEELDPVLEPILMKQTFRQGGITCIRLGDAVVEYDDKFKLYITTKYRNPHYLPEISTKVTLVNFLITMEGLSDQLLGVVAAQERPDLEAEKSQLIRTTAENAKALQDLENKILHILSTFEGNILEDETAITMLDTSKVLANEIQEKQQVARATERAIDITRYEYKAVADHASRLFFCITDLGVINPMYQYSLRWFSHHFVTSIQQAKRSDDIAVRIRALNEHFTYALFTNVSRSLFESDKLLFALQLALAISAGKGELNPSELFFLLTGNSGNTQTVSNPAPEWLSPRMWTEIVNLSSLPAFHGLHQDVAANLPAWKRFFDKDYPERLDFPGKWGGLGVLSRMQAMCLLRCLRPDKLLLVIQDFVSNLLGPKYLTPPQFDLSRSFNDSSFAQPLVFLLSPGADPMSLLLYFAETMSIKVHSISLGKGQGALAEALLKQVMPTGGWVVLQNCHLALSWMPALERIAEQLSALETAQAHGPTSMDIEINDQRVLVHPSFRLWLTSYPSPQFPVTILQNSVKMTNEPPAGLQQNLKRSYLSEPISDLTFFNSVENSKVFRRILFSLCLFHGLVQERRYFGPLGFNIPYEFNETDLRISVLQLAQFSDNPAFQPKDDSPEALIAAIPFDHIRYLTGECNYGGRVTDAFDRITLNAILKSLYTPDVFKSDFHFSAAKDWIFPPEEVTEHSQYLDFIDKLPTTTSPQVFGLHENANIARDTVSATNLFNNVLICQTVGAGGILTDGIGSTSNASEENENSSTDNPPTSGPTSSAGAAGAAGSSPPQSAASAPSSAVPSSRSHRPSSADSVHSASSRVSRASRNSQGSIRSHKSVLSYKKEVGVVPTGTGRDAVLYRLCTDMLDRLPALFDLEQISARHLKDPSDSMGVVLVQECVRYNRLNAVVRSSLESIQQAVQGLILLSEQLEAVANDLFIGKVPQLWKERSFASRKPLASYYNEFLDRHNMFLTWSEQGPPTSFWISGFFFTQSFITGVAQNFARKYVVPIDNVVFDPHMMSQAYTPEALDASKLPTDGSYIHGMYLNGCRWNYNNSVLDDSLPRVLYSPAPMMWLRPVVTKDLRTFSHYSCPLYKTSDRRGVLSTTGHSTNFVMTIRMPSSRPEEYWIQAGVCLLLNLDD